MVDRQQQADNNGDCSTMTRRPTPCIGSAKADKQAHISGQIRHRLKNERPHKSVHAAPAAAVSRSKGITRPPQEVGRI